MSASTDSSREVLVAFLKSSDARCPACRYALRGCTSDRCPECGSLVKLAVVSAFPRSDSWWFMGMIGLCSTAILLFLSLAAVLSTALREMQNPSLRLRVQAGLAPASELPPWRMIICFALVYILIAVALGLLAARRRELAQRSAWLQCVIGLAGVSSPLSVTGLMVLLSRWT